MALQTLTDDGQMEWNCSHCGRRNGAHMSDEGVVIHQRTGVPLHHRMVELPPCECGASTALKVHFTEAELQAPNFYDIVKVDVCDEAGNPLPVPPKIISKTRSASYDVAQRHMQLIARLDAAGKHPVAIPAPTSAGTVIALIGNSLTVSVDGVAKTSFSDAEQQALLRSLQQHGAPVNSFADVETLLKGEAPASGETGTGAVVVSKATTAG